MAALAANSARFMRGRQKVAWLFCYEGQDPAPRDNMTLTTGFPMYAPEILQKYAVFLTPAEIKRLKKGAQA